jgi:hypothetical protein
VAGLAGANKLGQSTAQAAAVADPFGPQRGQYAKMLSDLMAHPETIVNTPGYAAGTQAVERAGASQGFNMSGNMATALQKYGGDFYTNQVNTLGQLAGANINPGTAGQIIQQGGVNQQQLIGNSIGSLTAGANTLANLATPTAGA